MSDPVARIALLGATGLIGGAILAEAAARPEVRLTALARRAVPGPALASIETIVAAPQAWGEALATIQPRAVICALGTTWKKAGRNEAAFRAVDHDLVIRCAQAARAQRAERFVLVSSVGADPASRTFYLRVKGEVELALRALGFARLDILRPGLLLGERTDDKRVGERLGILAAPLINGLLRGSWSRYRGIPAQTVAQAALALCLRTAPGPFVHENQSIGRVAREWCGAVSGD